MLRCERCGKRVREAEVDGDRCPACGGRLLAPPDLLQTRWFRVALYATVGTLFALMLLIRASTYFMAFVDRALAFYGLSPAQSGQADRQRQLNDLLQDAERQVPSYPGSTRLFMRQTMNRPGTAPLLDVCWQSPGHLDDVVAFYRRTLPAQSWTLRGEGTAASRANQLLGAEHGQVRLLVHAPDDGAILDLQCPPGTTYAVSFTAFNASKG
jgi:hypothetical protein